MEGLREQGREVSRAVVRRQEGNMREALRGMSEEKRAMILRKREEARLRAAMAVAQVNKENEMEEEDDDDDTLFPSYSRGAPSSPQSQSQHARPSTPTPFTTTTTITPTAHHHITPTTTSPLLLPAPSTPTIPTPPQTLPTISPPAYALYKHLHMHSYFLSPGLRFGCQYMAYPGDPLRFHSHFLCRGYGWEEEIELLDLVGGGRLGTGVKKGFLIGGEEEREGGGDGGERGEGEMRTFCIEWGGM